ncbi:hypothetical protein K8I61_04105 [bacterium]|nr:hypothetical protein [bacterium]
MSRIFRTIFHGFLLTVFLALVFGGCTESCYKQEDNYADAGDAVAPSSTGGNSSTGCQVGEVHYQIDITHPTQPCLICGYLEDGRTKAWIPLVDGTECDDGRFCTGAGLCDRGRCFFEGNPCPANAPYCYEQYGGVCTEEPFSGDDDDSAGDDDDFFLDDDNDDDAVDDDAVDDDCWSCLSSGECRDTFGQGYGCLNGCCVSIPSDDDDAQGDDDNQPDDDTEFP